MSKKTLRSNLGGFQPPGGADARPGYNPRRAYPPNGVRSGGGGGGGGGSGSGGKFLLVDLPHHPRKSIQVVLPILLC